MHAASTIVAHPRTARPCTAAYARLAEVFPALRVEQGAPRSGGDWVTVADLVRDPAALRRLIAVEEARGPAEYGQPLRPDVAASFALHRYAWPVCLLFSLPWFLERRVPRLPVDAVSMNRPAGMLTAEPVTFACLPDDPAAGLPHARVVPDEAALRRELLAAVAEHLEPLLAVFRPQLRRGPRTLWGMATDELVEGLWYLGSLLGEEERAAAELTELLPGTTPPFAGRAGFRPLDQGPGQEPIRTRTRVSCCLFYTVRPAEACFSCPRTCDVRRDRSTLN
ncbi:(2Fe-2S)-binding protein [Streptomyces sp. NPDC092296]|uniref:(2Fe-2S)-binding protein n=1 Tax=Streptomyces sp. NPDC092296 TaxID=3366012 RepID=UPI0037FFA2C1